MATVPSEKKPRSQSRQRPIVASARLNSGEFMRLRERAAAHNLSVSNYLRHLVQLDTSVTIAADAVSY